MAQALLVGRQSSHFTRVVRIVAAELEVPLRLQPIFDLMSLDPADYGGNPALKLPVLLRGDDAFYGCLNICRVLAAGSGRGELVVFPEHGLDPLHLDAAELVFNAMGVHTEIVFHEVVSRRPPDAASLKRRAGLLGSLAWLDARLDAVLARLPPRRTSLVEVALFCLLEHIPFRNPMDLSGFPRLADFVREFGARPSAQATPYRFDAPPPAATPATGDATAIGALASELEVALRDMADHRALATDPRFGELVARLEAADPARRLDWMMSGALTLASAPLCAASLQAMARRGDGDPVAVARVLDRVGYYALPFALDLLGRSDDPRVLGLVLLRLGGWAAEYPSLREQVWQYLAGRHAAGVMPELADEDFALDWSFEDRRNALADFDGPAARAVLAELDRVDRERQGVARRRDFAHCPGINARLDHVVASIVQPSQPGVLLVGESGAGKTSVIRAALRSLTAEGWTVVEASPRDLFASVRHVHPPEEAIETLVAGLSGERHVWHALRWFELLDDPGDGSPMPMERLWPWLRQGRLRLIGACTDYTRQRAVQDLPGFESLVAVQEVAGLDDAGVAALARDWALREANRHGTQCIEPAVLDAALAMARRARPGGVEPGRSLGLLQDALAAVRADPSRDGPITHADLRRALAARSGLPVDRLAQA